MIKITITGLMLLGLVLIIRSCSLGELPADQIMIDNFNANKREFVELAKIFNESDVKLKILSDRSDMVDLVNKTGVGFFGSGVGGIWLDDPYSLESAIKSEEMSESGKYVNKYFGKIGIFRMIDRDKYYAVYFFNGGTNWKDYVYIPVDPEIREGRVRLSRTPWENKPHLWRRVLDSLDDPDWERGECVLRKIEPKWFLRRCRAN